MSIQHSGPRGGGDGGGGDGGSGDGGRTRHHSYDIVVVGAGPAGSSAALAAARGGASVALLEREPAVAETVRTSGVTWMADVEEFGIPPDCFNPVRNFSFRSPNNEVTIGDAVPRAAVLDVRKTYRWLAAGAREAGADLHVSTTVSGALRDRGGDIAGVSGTGPDGARVTFGARVVIDASGFPSAVCRAMGLAPRWRRFGAGAEYEARAEHVDRHTWWLMVGRRYSPAGYAWIFPLGEDTVRIGVGIGKPESDVDPAQRLRELVEAGEGPIGDLGRITPTEFHYGLIPNDGTSRKTVFNNMILVGDSAGQANPLVLEGIRYAIRFGRKAGEVAAGAVASGRTDSGALRPYERHWRGQVGSRLSTARRVQDRWIALSDEEWDRELDVIRELGVEEFLDFIRADFGLSRMVGMAAHHPRLAVRQLFGLVRGRMGGGGTGGNSSSSSSDNSSNSKKGRGGGDDGAGDGYNSNGGSDDDDTTSR